MGQIYPRYKYLSEEWAKQQNYLKWPSTRDYVIKTTYSYNRDKRKLAK